MSGNSTVHMILTKADRYLFTIVKGMEANIKFIIRAACQLEIMGFLTKGLVFTVFLILLE